MPACRASYWHAFSKRQGDIPQLNGATDDVPKENMIPIEALKEIANGEFSALGQLTDEQQRGLRRIASAAIAARQLNEKRAKR